MFSKKHLSPQLRQPSTTKAMMSDVMVALMPTLGMAVFFFGVRVLALCAVSLLSLTALAEEAVSPEEADTEKTTAEDELPAAPAAVAAGETAVNSPMPGNVFKVECKPGQAVKAGDVLVILEAMKMEIEVTAPVDGTVKSVAAAVGTAVNTDDLLVTLG